MTLQEIHTLFIQSTGVVIDTRKIQPGSFFVALKGERFDANTFSHEALALGASCVIIDNKEYYVDERTILVEDSLKLLQELASFHREFLNIPILALTGSNGKTTTKELIHAVLSKKFNTKATFGNLNNHIGVPLTLLSFTNQTQIGVVEMGANHQKEIEFLCQIAKPDYGYITNFGKAHLEGFGGVEGVIKGKSEMYLYLFENHKTVFVNADDILQYDKTVNSKRVTFSCHNKECDVFFSKIEANPFVSIQFNDVYIQSHLIGLYNATNSCAAITIGSYFGVSKHDIKQAIESYIPENNRSQIVKKGTNEIILDAYNANPTSMKAALENFLQLDKPHKMIIVGDMFELGTASLEEHRIIVNFLKEESCITCCFVGSDFFSNKIEKENFYFFKDFDTLSTFLSGNHLENRSILIKGSRGMALERTLEFI